MQKENNFEAADFLKIGFYIGLASLVWNLPTLGNNLMPRNFMAWFGIILISCLVLGFSSFQKKLVFDKTLALLFIPPLAFLIHGLVFPPVETMSYYMWLAMGITLFFAFYVLALMQVHHAHKVWLDISNLMGAVLLVQILVSEIFPLFSFGTFVLEFLPIELKGAQAGFQQPNLLVTFAVTAAFWMWALRIKFSEHRWASWIFILIFNATVTYVVLKYDSRVGYISYLIGISLLTIYLFKCKYNRIFYSPILGFVIGISLYIFSTINDQQEVSNQISLISGDDGGSTSFRLSTWYVSILSGLKNVFWGHGLGNFSSAYYETFAAYKINNPNSIFLSGLAHPHNEILLHWVEMGLWGLFLVITPYVVFLLKIVLQKSSNTLLLIICLLPVGLHSQTEMVLHASGAHWMLVGLVLASLPTKQSVTLISLPRYSYFGLSILGAFGLYTTFSTALVANSAWQSNANANAADNFGLHLKRLTSGPELSHWIMKTDTNDRVIKTMMAYAINTKNLPAIRKFLPRLVDQNSRWQHRDGWAMIAQAYLMLGDYEAYKLHISKIKALEPTFVEYLEKEFNVRLDN